MSITQQQALYAILGAYYGKLTKTDIDTLFDQIVAIEQGAGAQPGADGLALLAEQARTDGAISRDSFSGEQLRAAYEVSTARGYSPEGSEAGIPSTPAAGNFAEWARVWHDTASAIATIAGGDPNLDPKGMIESVQNAAPLLKAEQAKDAAEDAPRERTPQDYAIEHAEYMAVDGEHLIAAIDDFGKALQEVDDGTANPSDVDAARETLREALGAMRSGIYEFRKRRDRAARAAERKA